MSPTFEALPLRPELLEALTQIGYTVPTLIQAAALPAILAGEDVIGQAETGGGKTAAFGLGLLNGLVPGAGVQALVLCPTRELAGQVAAELRRLAQRLANVQVLTITGGTPIHAQVQSLAGGCGIIVGTPGRLGDHLRRGLDLGGLRVLVLDEADRMLAMGFIEQVTTIVDACPADRQTLLFSATFPDEIAALSDHVQSTPAFIAATAQAVPDAVAQYVFECAPEARWQAVADLLATYRPESALVFCETRVDCDALARSLRERGAVALALHGEMEQRDRADVLVQFGNGSASVLVATNVAARGIDIADIPVVIVAELSRKPEDHLHRVGRTGRAGSTGLALSLVATGPEAHRLANIEAFLGHALEAGPALQAAERLDFLIPPNRTLLLLAGRKAKLRKGDVLGALIKDAGLPPTAIGRIDLTAQRCAVAIERRFAQKALRFAQSARIKKARVRAILLG